MFDAKETESGSANERDDEARRGEKQWRSCREGIGLGGWKRWSSSTEKKLNPVCTRHDRARHESTSPDQEQKKNNNNNKKI